MRDKKIDKFINQIIEDDCLEVMAEIPDNSVDMTFADPPFNLNKKYNHYDDSKEKGEYLDWCKKWLSEMVRITNPTGAIFVHNIPRWLTYFSYYLNEMAYFRHWIAWNAGGAPLGKTLLPHHYGILYYTKEKSHKKFKFNDIRSPHERCRVCKEFLKDYGGKKDQMHGYGPLISDVWTDIHRIRHKKRRDNHPCQLPVPLLERLVLMSTEEGDIVFDPFVGAGTAAVAAKQMGRKYIGIEIDPEYVEITEKNLKEARETKINGKYVSVYLGEIRTIRDKDYKAVWENKEGDLKFLDNKRYKITKKFNAT